MLASLTIISLALLLVSGTDFARGLQRAGAEAIQPVQAVVAEIAARVSTLVQGSAEADRLRAEDARLRQDLARAAQRLAALQQVARDDAALRVLLDLRQSLPMRLVAARVISRDPDPIAWQLGIGAGSADGVRVGMPVVAASPTGEGALVGVVVDVTEDAARIRLVVDPASAVVGRDLASGALGVVRGQAGGQLVMTEIEATDTVQVGDTVVTAGLVLGDVARSPYPPGLWLGIVQAVQHDPGGLTLTAFARPAIQPSALDWVLVVIDFPAD